ncbi:MAG: hypothetical protein FWG90_09745 [Oscillospiraceae bacterium]|nr:hypothetical protein [Oscillospiraceae bacterium]
MKRKLSLLLAAIMAASILAACQRTDEDIDGLPPVPEETSVITPMTTTEETTTTPEITTTEATETEEETTTVSETTTTATETASQTTTAAAGWRETAISGVYYTNQACYSRRNAIIGSEQVRRYEKGERVTVVAVTDTGYYKLTDGSFIHSDYLTEEAPATTTARTTAGTTATTTTRVTTTTTAAPTESTATVTVDPNATQRHKVDYTQRLGYQQLGEKQKQLYSNIVNAAYNLQTRVSVPDGLLSDDIYKVYGLVYNQEPQLFWMTPNVPFGFGSITLSYLVRSADELTRLQNELATAASTIVNRVNAQSGDYNRVKAIYEHLILANEFAESGDGWSSTAYNGVLGKGAGLQCAGYAKSFLYLCDLAGINAMVIPGLRFDGMSHAWNKVSVGGSWYNIDATWGDPKNSHDKNYIRYAFFLVPDSWITTSHLKPATGTRASGTVITYFTPPAATSTTNNYFKVNNKEFDTLAAAEAGLLAEFDEAFKTPKKNTAHIRVTDKRVYDRLLTDESALKFQRYARENGGASRVGRQTTALDGVMVVQYDIWY